MAATEIKEQPRQLDYTREGFYRGRRIFGCLTGTAWTDGLAFIGTDFPGAPSGVEPPKGCRWRVIRRPRDGRRDWLIVDYETSMRGKALVYVDQTMRQVRITTLKDGDGTVHVEGPWTLAPDGATPAGRVDEYESVVTGGSNVVNQAFFTYTIVTAYSTEEMNNLKDKILALTGRSYNGRALTKFVGGVGVKKLLWAGSQRKYTRTDEVGCIFRVVYNPDGWDLYCKSTPGVWVTEEQAVHDAAGALAGDGRTKDGKAFLLGKGLNAAGAVIDAPEQTYDIFVAGDMSFLDDLTVVA